MVLRERACQALAEGLSGREVARRFLSSAANISRWRSKLREIGLVSAAAMGGLATRVTQEFDDRVREIAEQTGLKIVEILEAALAAYERENNAAR